jgi:ATP-dependent RNA helicase RhlE
MTSFSELNLIGTILKAVESEGYSTPTPIQVKSIPHLLDGRDLMGLAQTGTGKTAAFTLPMLQRLSESGLQRQRNAPRALVLAPTRELAGQIADSIRTYGQGMPLRYGVVFGGVSIRPQIQTLGRGIDILVATPGRLLDLMQQGACKLSRVEIFILDEADRMLDMGFIPDVRRIVAKIPDTRQTALFSATMPSSVTKLANDLLTDPIRVEAAPAATTVERVDQRVLFVPKDKKRSLLTELLTNDDIERVLIFTRTKHMANRVAQHLERTGVQASAIHGNKSQSARQKALDSFKSGRLRALVATDIAARGIDVDGVTHVINFDLPNEPESYVHRIGRTARAGASGMAISFCDGEERAYLRDIEKTIRQSVLVDEDHPFHGMVPANAPGDGKPGRTGFKKKRSRRRSSKGGQMRRSAA